MAHFLPAAQSGMHCAQPVPVGLASQMARTCSDWNLEAAARHADREPGLPRQPHCLSNPERTLTPATRCHALGGTLAAARSLWRLPAGFCLYSPWAARLHLLPLPTCVFTAVVVGTAVRPGSLHLGTCNRQVQHHRVTSISSKLSCHRPAICQRLQASCPCPASAALLQPACLLCCTLPWPSGESRPVPHGL